MSSDLSKMKPCQRQLRKGAGPFLPAIRNITPPMTAIRIFWTSSSSRHFIHFMPTVATKMAISPSRMPTTIKARVACKVPGRKHFRTCKNNHVQINKGRVVEDQVYFTVEERKLKTPVLVIFLQITNIVSSPKKQTPGWIINKSFSSNILCFQH